MVRKWVWSVMALCGLLVCMVTSIAQHSTRQDSCREIGKVLTEKFQKHTMPTDVQNLFTCTKGVTCCNTISEYFFQHNVEQQFTKFALYTVSRRLDNFKDGMYAQQVNWETFNSLIEQVENGLQITYEDFFELALFEIITIKDECMMRKEIKQLKQEAMTDIITLVNNIYAYQKGVQAINVTLQATASLQPSRHCSANITKAGIPLDMRYKPAGCPLCLDSTSTARVCKDLCLNVVRGCYASILRYKHIYLQLVDKMDEIYFTLNYHLEMQNGSLYTFIDKIEKHLKKKEFADKCSEYGRTSDKKRRKKRQGAGPDLTHFEEYFSKQLSLESAIVDPATLPCAPSNNTPPCWNGYSLGNYKHLAYSYTMDEQEINPEGSDLELTEYQQSAVDMMNHALQLANKTSHNEHLFPIMRPTEEGPTEPPPEPTDKQQNITEPRVTTKPAQTDKPAVNTIENNVEPTRSTFSSVDTNARRVMNSNEDSDHSHRLHYSFPFLLFQLYIILLVVR